MDLTAIEPTSVAIRAGQVAAAELANLLGSEEAIGPVDDWFDPVAVAATEEDLVALTAIVDRLGGYVCHAGEPVAGERLYRWAVQQDLIRRVDWADQPFARRQPFELFAATVRTVYLPLKAEQDRLEVAGAAPPKQLGLALEDSIFEPEESLGTLRPEAVQALRNMAAAEAAKAKAPKPAPAPAAAPAPSSPLSIGEAPPRPPANRGGRGNRRTE